jgi:hypothetical protein
LIHLDVMSLPIIELYQYPSKNLRKRQDFGNKLLAATTKKLPNLHRQGYCPVRVGASLSLLLQEGPTPFCLAEQPFNGMMAYLTEVISP